MNPLLLTDGYKTSHHKMYPEGTTLVYSNFTPRSVKFMPEQAKKVAVFGIQYTVKYIHEIYQEHFFSKPKNDVIQEAKMFLDSYLGVDYDVSHFEKLHDLGYLPLHIKGLQEGTLSTEKIPILTIYNTHPDFYWLPNFLETLISSLLWKPLHSASMAYAYKQIMLKYAKETDEKNLAFVDFQGHDFSFRGMQHPESAISSAMGFLTCFKGTDTIPALQATKKYYNSDNVGFSVPASEHSVMCAGEKDSELDTFRRLLKVYPTGILSVVSDTWDLWKVCTEHLVTLKEEILARDGKLVIRPDSGDPVDIICGLPESCWHLLAKENSPIKKGVIELLWDVFGGTVNEQGYKVLDSHIGAIYGDSITLERAVQICERLKAKGFASTNIVFGVGSYSMGYATRDNQGNAVKCTYVEINGKGVEVFKDPVTDGGSKKSAKGLVGIFLNGDDSLRLEDQLTWEQEKRGLLETVYVNGGFENEITLEQVREKINNYNLENA